MESDIRVASYQRVWATVASRVKALRGMIVLEKFGVSQF